MSGFTSKNTSETNNKNTEEEDSENQDEEMKTNVKANTDKRSKASPLTITQSTSTTPSSLTEEYYVASLKTQSQRLESLRITMRVKHKLNDSVIDEILNKGENRYKMIFSSIDKEIWNNDTAAQMLNFIFLSSKQPAEARVMAQNQT